MVLTAIGVFAGTFLSWPVALLTTIFVLRRRPGGLRASSLDFARQSLRRRRPVRVADPAAHPREPDDRAGADARRSSSPRRSTRSSTPVMSRLVYVVPNFAALDVSNTVADGLRRDLARCSGQPAPGPRLRLAVLHRRVFHPEESGGRRMNANPTNQQPASSSTPCSSSSSSCAMYPVRRAGSTGRRPATSSARPRIGQVDTGSFMLKLALLGGARGIAANVLWSQAEDSRRVHDWDRLKQTVDLITKLQPHFLSIWTFQGWNLAYNVSVEWDAPEDKYEWIKKGIKFVEEGVEQEREVARPALGHRLVLLPQARIRRRGDHPPQALPRRRRRGVQDATPIDQASSSDDNFLLGYGWFSRPIKLVDEGRGSGSPTGMRGEPRLRRRADPAQGPARRPRLPLDARARPDPLRRRPREGEHPGRPGHLRRDSQDEWRQALTTTGSSSATYSSLAGTTTTTRSVQIDDATEPHALREAHRQPEVLDRTAGPTR